MGLTKTTRPLKDQPLDPKNPDGVLPGQLPLAVRECVEEFASQDRSRQASQQNQTATEGQIFALGKEMAVFALRTAELSMEHEQFHRYKKLLLDHLHQSFRPKLERVLK